MITPNRRNFLRGMAAAVPAAATLSAFSAQAAPMRKKVKITDVRMMLAKTNANPTNWIKIESDAGIDAALREVCGIDAAGKLAGMVKKAYSELK